MVRKSLGFAKTKKNQLHEVHAYCIALLALGCTDAVLPTFEHVYQMKQFRRAEQGKYQQPAGTQLLLRKAGSPSRKTEKTESSKKTIHWKPGIRRWCNNMAKKKPSVDVLFYRLRKVPGIIIRLDV